MRVIATTDAEATVRKVLGEGRPELVMVLGTGCCDSTAPFLYDRYYPGPDVVKVGEIEGIAVLAPMWLAELYTRATLQLDVDEGAPNDSLSLESEFDCRFTLRVEAEARGG